MDLVKDGESSRVSTNDHHFSQGIHKTSFLLLLAVQLSTVLTYNYYSRVEEPLMDNRIALHNVIVTLAAPYQFRYRILVPFTIDVIGRLLPRSVPVKSSDPLKALPFSRDAFAGLYAASNFLAFALMLSSLGFLLRKSFRYELALFGMAISAILIDFTFRDHYFHPWSFWEGAFFALGLLLIQERRYWLFGAVNILGLLNRETSVFLCLAFLLSAFPSPLRGVRLNSFISQPAMFAACNVMAWILGYFVLHATVGYRPPTFFVETAWTGNVERWPYALLLNALFLGPLWFPAIRGLGSSPLLFRRAALVIPLYLVLLLVIGFWWEIRYWISMIPFLVVGLVNILSKQSEQPA